MNRHFICIKVDREERPDLDLFYMEASRMFNQSADGPSMLSVAKWGPPLVWNLFSQGRQGTGIAPWPQVLMRSLNIFVMDVMNWRKMGSMPSQIWSTQTIVTYPIRGNGK